MKRFRSVSWLFLPLLLSPTSFAHAYLDPGNGSYIIQVVTGVLFGAAYAMKSYYGRVVAFLKKRFGSKKDE